MNIEVLMGPPGCGKSYDMRQEAIRNTGLYLFAYPSIKLLREQATAFRAEALGQVEIIEAHSEARGSGSVQNRLERHRSFLSSKNITHAVILITHEGMMGADLRGFSDWHVRIDEAPNTLQSGQVKAPASAAILKQAIAIDPVGSAGWGEIRLIGGKHSWRDLANDDLFKPLAEMLKQADRRHGVFVNTVDWKDSFGWCSIWPLASLGRCKSVKIAGASYPVSLGALVAERWEARSIKFLPTAKPMTRTRQPTIRIHYFTQSHEGTTLIWRKRIGSGFIAKVCDFLVKNEPHLGYWAANKEVVSLLDHRLNGEPISPKPAGINELDDRISCALIYSSKPQPNDKPAQDLFEIGNDEILRAREEEDILQFVMRGAIRRPEFGGVYDIYLYSKRQAELVAEKLTASGIGNSVELIPEPDAGIMDADPDPAKTTRKAVSSAKSAAYKQREAARKKTKRAADAVAAGRVPSANGRPTKKPK